jgi:hypothetical protein
MSGKRSASDAVGEPESSETSKRCRLRSAVDESLTHLVCAITQELPLDPVTAEDGNIYERSAIEEWLSRQQKSPMTNQPMGTKLLPAFQIRSMIETMVRSGGISGEMAESWRTRRDEEQERAAVKEQADNGDVGAMAKLAMWSREGCRGLRKDLRQSLRWLERAAKAGSLEALRYIGGWYLFGYEPVAKDVPTGLVYLTEAAAHGDGSACRLLGDVYRIGKLGPPKSVEHARKWYERACKADGWSENSHKERVEAWLREHAHGPAEWVLPSVTADWPVPGFRA